LKPEEHLHRWISQHFDLGSLEDFTSKEELWRSYEAGGGGVHDKQFFFSIMGLTFFNVQNLPLNK
jgi:hypothetical protein